MVTENIDIVIRSRGARVTATGIDRIGQKAATATRNLFLLQRALFVVGAGAILRGIQNLSDTFTDMQNRLKLVTSGTADLVGVTEELFAISNRTRTAFEATATIFSRTALSVQQLGISQRETLQFTESLSKAIILSGAGAQEATAAMIQLGQGLASNRLSGDELRSVLEQLPFVADVIAKSLSITRGELRAFGKEGKITAITVLNAFREAREEIAEKFAKTIPTIGQAFIVLKNNVIETIGAFNTANGAAQGFAAAIIFLASNFDTLFNILAVGITLFAALQFGKLVQGISNFSVATVKNTKAQIANNVAKVKSIAHITSERIARQAAIETMVANIQTERAALQTSLALNIATQQEIAIRVEAATIIANETGNTRNLNLQRNLLAASTQGIITTEAALATTQTRLVASTTALGIATTATASAQTNLARATASVTLAARAATVAMGFLTRVLAFFGGGIGLAITAISVGILAIATGATRAERNLEAVNKSVRKIAVAFGEVGGNVDLLLKSLDNFSLAEAIEESKEALEIFNEGFEKLIRTASQEIKFATNIIDPEQQVIVDELNEAIATLQETGNLIEFRASLDKIAAANPEFNELIASINNGANEVLGFGDTLKRAAIDVKVLKGTATDAEREFNGFEVSIERNTSALEKLQIAAADANERFEDIVSGSAEETKAFKALEDLKTVTLGYNQSIADLTEQRKLGNITTLDSIADEARLIAAFKASIAGLSGQEKIIKTATTALTKYSAEAKKVDLSNVFLSDRDRGTAEAAAQFQILLDTIDLITDEVEKQELLNEAASDFTTILNSIEEGFNRIDMVNLADQAKVFDDAADSIRNENLQLESMIRNFGEVNVVEEQSIRLGQTMTFAQRELAIETDKVSTVLKEELSIMKSLISPTKTAGVTFEALDNLLAKGLITIGEYNRLVGLLENSLISLGSTASQISGPLKALFAAIPELREAASIQAQLIDLENARGKAVKLLNAELAARPGEANQAQELGRLNAQFDRAANVVSKRTEKIIEATDANIDFIRSGEDSASSILENNIRRINDLFEENVILAIGAGATKERLDKLEISRIQQITKAREDAAKKAAKAASRDANKFTFQRAVDILEAEAKALINVIAGREEENAVIALGLRLKRELTGPEADLIIHLREENNALARQADLFKDLTSEGPDILTLFSDLNILFAAGAINAQQFNQAMEDNTFAWLEFKESIGEATFAEGILLGLEDLAFGVSDFTSEAGRLFGEFTENMVTGFSNAISGMILGTTTLRDAIFQVAQSALGALISALVKLGIQQVLNAVLGQSIAAAATAAQAAQAVALAAAYAPAAAAVSLASFGANAVPAQLGMSTTAALATTLFGGGGAFFGPGFAHGGSIVVGGSGGIDSQLVQLRATPNERIDILTPGQQQARDRLAREEDNRDQSRTQINSFEINYVARAGEDRGRSASELAKEIADTLAAITDRDGV